MKTYDRFFLCVIAAIAVVFAAANLILLRPESPDGGKPYRVEINRLTKAIESSGFEELDLSECTYVTNIEKYGEGFYDTDSDYAVREISGELYRFDYSCADASAKSVQTADINIVLAAMSLLIIGVMLFIRQKILKPFERLSDVPYELSKGNLTAPIKESKSRFFGRFVWGIDMLRENIEQQKQRELEMLKDRKTLLLSLSHDIKTPLSAIKLYSKALSKGLYSDKEKQIEVAESIGAKADEIESYVSQIISASREDFLSLEVNSGEFYLSSLVGEIEKYYSEKLALVKTDFIIGDINDCILSGDPERSVEVMQNIIENALKYGDGKRIALHFVEEDGYVLISVENSGCDLLESELPHIFDSFWRGSNSAHKPGSGLGLYICRKLMMKMNGDIFAEISGSKIRVTAVFKKA